MQAIRTEEGTPARGTAVQRMIAAQVTQVVGAFKAQVASQGRWRGVWHASPFPASASVARWCSMGTVVCLSCCLKMARGQYTTNTRVGSKRLDHNGVRACQRGVQHCDKRCVLRYRGAADAASYGPAACREPGRANGK